MVNIKSFPNNQDEYIGAEEVMRWHHGRSSGVFGADGNAAVAPILNTMAVEVSDGNGWLANEKGYGVAWWIENEAKNGKKLQLSVDMADAILPRIDRVIVSWQTTNYVALPQVRILKGTPASKPVAPALTNDSLVRMISLAAIRIPAGATIIDASMITDERMDASVCGIVTDAVGVDTSVMQAQFASFWANNIADFEAYREQQNADLEAYVASQKDELEALVANHQTELDAYIASQQTKLDVYIDRQQTELDDYIVRQQTAWEAFIDNSEELGLVPIPAPADRGKAVMVNGTGNGYVLSVIQNEEQFAAHGIKTDGDGAAYTATVEGITALTAGAAFIMIPHTKSTTLAPTLNVNGLGAKELRQRSSANTGSSTHGDVEDWIVARRPVFVMYDGFDWVVEVARPYANSIYGTVAVEKGGTGHDSISDTKYTEPRYRASALFSADTNPTINGVINWTYK